MAASSSSSNIFFKDLLPCGSFWILSVDELDACVVNIPMGPVLVHQVNLFFGDLLPRSSHWIISVIGASNR